MWNMMAALGFHTILLSHTLIILFYSVGANSIGDDGIKSIAAVFKSCNTLKELQ